MFSLNDLLSKNKQTFEYDHNCLCWLLFNFTKYYFVLSATGQEKIHLEEGEHMFPFQFQLPTTGPLPQPFEGRFGQIRYKIQAQIIRPWKFNHVTERYFSVVGHVVDLNNFEQVTVIYSFFFVCLFCVFYNKGTRVDISRG